MFYPALSCQQAVITIIIIISIITEGLQQGATHSAAPHCRSMRRLGGGRGVGAAAGGGGGVLQQSTCAAPRCGRPLPTIPPKSIKRHVLFLNVFLAVFLKKA